jgi:hypothetical protein
MRARFRLLGARGAALSPVWLALWLAAAQAAAQATPAPGATATGATAAAGGKPLPQVTVEADRVRLGHRLFTFVSSISRAIPRDESLRRWQVPICPLVAGLTQDEAEFMLARLSQIVRQAGAPLDKEHCVQPNLVVIVTPKPDELLNAWNAHRHAAGKLYDYAASFRRWRQTPRPIRVWYNHNFGSAEGSPVLNGSLQVGRASWGAASGGYVASLMSVKDVLQFSSVAVIVDARQIVGLQIGQICDYIAMAALTEPDLDAPLADAPTILRLFSARAAGKPLPEGLGDWDRAFLKSLYEMNLADVTQRSQITGRMLEDLAPR